MVRNYKRKTVDRWSKEDLLEALLMIKDSKLKINDAARLYGISRATLYRQYQKFIAAGGKNGLDQFRTCGGNPILSPVEEDILAKTVLELRGVGYTVTGLDVKRICYEYCDTNGVPNYFNVAKRTASDDWYYGFLKRRPEVALPKKSPELTTQGVEKMDEEDKSARRVPPAAVIYVDGKNRTNQLGGKRKRGKQDRESLPAAPQSPAKRKRRNLGGNVESKQVAATLLLSDESQPELEQDEDARNQLELLVSAAATATLAHDEHMSEQEGDEPGENVETDDEVEDEEEEESGNETEEEDGDGVKQETPDEVEDEGVEEGEEEEEEESDSDEEGEEEEEEEEGEEEEETDDEDSDESE